jgi:hypothetical protein
MDVKWPVPSIGWHPQPFDGNRAHPTAASAIGWIRKCPFIHWMLTMPPLWVASWFKKIFRLRATTPKAPLYSAQYDSRWWNGIAGLGLPTKRTLFMQVSALQINFIDKTQTGLRLQLGPVLDWVDKKVPVPSIGWHPQPFDGTESFYSFRKGCTLEKRMKPYSMKIVRVSARTIGLKLWYVIFREMR